MYEGICNFAAFNSAIGNENFWMGKGRPKITFENIHHNVFWPAAAIILAFLSITIAYKDTIGSFFEKIQESTATSSGWFFIITVNLVLIFCFFVAFSRFGKIRLGGQEAKTEFSTPAWFAMLFSAGMGIGILFWSVAEPISHYSSRPMGATTDAMAAKDSMDLSFLHWGLHAWGIYALVGLGLSYFAFNKKLPLTISSLFYPLLGKRVYGLIGDVIDILAVIATLFGLATSLGLGAQQISSGLNFLYGWEVTDNNQVMIITGVTFMATISVVLGIDKGVRRLSELNLVVAALFLTTMIIVGPTLFIADSFVSNLGSYINTLPKISFWTEAYEQTNWQNDWTVFYWAWWIAWSPFVGMFIARVSRGRTIKEFILGVLIVPSIVTFLWFSAFGGTAIFTEMNDIGIISAAVNEDVSTALFKLLDQFPWPLVSSTIGVVLIISFFVTSSDSGSLVIDSITSGGKLDAPKGQRVFWALTEGAAAIALLLGGGLTALQTVSITSGLPFAVMLLIICYSLYKSLKDYKQEE